MKGQNKGQSIAEYMILIGIIVAAVIAMQTYARRSVQAVIKVAADGIGSQDDVFASGSEKYSQTSSTFAGSCSQVGGTCSSVAGTETTTAGIPASDAASLKAKGLPLRPMPMTDTQYAAIGASGLPVGGNVFYYTAPTTTQSSATQSILTEERVGGERFTQILQDQSNAVVIGDSRTEYYEKEQ